MLLWFQTQTRSTNHFQTGQFPKDEIAQIPSVGQSQSGGGADGQTEEMLKVLRGILNKLTPERFEGLVKQVDELNIDTEESLKAVIELVFKKAVSEQSYSMAYAKMCHHMKGVRRILNSHDRLISCQIIGNYMLKCPPSADGDVTEQQRLHYLPSTPAQTMPDGVPEQPT